MPKKVLIVTGATGAGHNSVAKTLHKAIEELAAGAVEVTVLDYVFAGRRSWIGSFSRLYAPMIVRFPFLWGAAYHLSNSRRLILLLRALAGLTAARHLARALISDPPDLIVCVHPLFNQVVAAAVRRTGVPLPLVTVITDLAEPHAAWVAPEVTLYAAPTEEVRQGLVAQGVEPGRVRVVGLPVDRRFFECGEATPEALPSDGTPRTLTLLLTGGGEGAGAMYDAALALAHSGLAARLIVVCGRNDTLRHRLNVASLPIRSQVLGFCDDMPALLRAADVVVGKAGALNIGEAVAARKSLVFFRSLPGQEAANVRFACARGLGTEVPDVGQLVKLARRWATEPDKARDQAVYAVEAGPRAGAHSRARQSRVAASDSDGTRPRCRDSSLSLGITGDAPLNSDQIRALWQGGGQTIAKAVLQLAHQKEKETWQVRPAE